MSEDVMAAHRARVERARVALNATPWWKPLKRQDAATAYRYALFFAALAEMNRDPHAAHLAAQRPTPAPTEES